MTVDEMSFFSLERNDGGQLAYYTRPGNDPPLVLIPGSFGDRYSWTEFLSSFDSERRIVIVEMRGHGNSQPPSLHSDIEELADDVLHVVGVLCLTRWYVAGHSIGGMIAIELSGRLPVSEVGLVGAVALEGWSHHEVLTEAFGGDKYNTLSSEKQLERSAKHSLAMSQWNDKYVRYFASLWRKWDAGPILSRTQVPILEVWGDRGRTPPDHELMRIPERENIEVQWIPNASHSLLFECPEKVAGIVEGFISRLTSE